MWCREGQGHHLFSADGSRNNCPFSAGKLPQGIVLGWKHKVRRRKASNRQESQHRARERRPPRRRWTGLSTQGRASFLVLLLPVTPDPPPTVKLRDLETQLVSAGIS